MNLIEHSGEFEGHIIRWDLFDLEKGEDGISAFFIPEVVTGSGSLELPWLSAGTHSLDFI